MNVKELKVMRSVSKNWKNGLKRKAVFALLASIGLVLTSCKPQTQAIVHTRTTSLPTLKIDTCFVFARDTAFIFDTDTFRIETIIRDTLISQHIETKPFTITTSDTVYINTKTAQKTENKPSKKSRLFATVLLFAGGVALIRFFSIIQKR